MAARQKYEWEDEKSVWERMIDKGEILYKYMINNFETLFDGTSKIKHFHNKFWMNGYTEYPDHIEATTDDKLQSELISWIRNEHKSGDLFIYENWKPFRDPYAAVPMYMGYKKWFEYKDHYLHLGIAVDCYNHDFCDDCENNTYPDPPIHFEVIMYGWKEEGKVKLQPFENVTIPTDNLMPQWYWEMK
jgi:hypothetical protein